MIDYDGDLRRCWRHQDCKGCLAEQGCGWCPFSWVCVPNNYSVPLLAPAYDEGICPHWAERWEIRTRPLGCQVSTITSLTSIISIVSTLVFVLLLSLLALLYRRLRKLHKEHSGWWDLRRADWRSMRPWWWWTNKSGPSAEQSPLLGA